MEKPLRFKWAKGERTFLWPNHPLIIAGDHNLETVVQDLQEGHSRGEICKKLLQKNNLPYNEVNEFVCCVDNAIKGMTPDNVIEDNKPDAESLAMATINLTKNCNLRCLHCYAGDSISSFQDEITREDIKKSIGELATLVTRQPRLLILSGGEPLLEKNKLVEAVLVGKQHGFDVRLNTNGLLVDADIAHFLSEHDVLTQVSLDGANASTNTLLRGSKEVFNKTLKSLDLLLQSGCRTRISTTIHSLNVHQIPEMIELSIKLGVEQFVTSSLVGIGNARTNSIIPVGFSHEFSILYGAVRENIQKQKMTRSTLLAETIIAMRKGLRFVYCGTGCSTLCIDADGRIYPCINMVFDQYAIGNIKNDNINDLWHKSSILQRIRNLNISSMNPLCSKCPFRHFCGGYCRGETLAAGYDIDSPYVRCREWKRGLTKVLNILAESPDIYDFGEGFATGIRHHE